MGSSHEMDVSPKINIVLKIVKLNCVTTSSGYLHEYKQREISIFYISWIQGDIHLCGNPI